MRAFVCVCVLTVEKLNVGTKRQQRLACLRGSDLQLDRGAGCIPSRAPAETTPSLNIAPLPQENTAASAEPLPLPGKHLPAVDCSPSCEQVNLHDINKVRGRLNRCFGAAQRRIGQPKSREGEEFNEGGL